MPFMLRVVMVRVCVGGGGCGWIGDGAREEDVVDELVGEASYGEGWYIDDVG